MIDPSTADPASTVIQAGPSVTCWISRPIADGLVTQVRDGRLARYYSAQDQAGASAT